MTHIEREARKIVTAAQKRHGPQTLRFMVAQTNAAPSRELTDEIRRVLAVKRGWELATFKRNGRQMWVYRKPKEGESWGSGAEAVEHAKSGRAERPDDGLRALPSEDGTRAACAENLTLDITMDGEMKEALHEVRVAAAKRDAVELYSKGRWDGVWIGWGLGLPAGVALTLLATLAVMWWLS